jgi:hypothetical protein
MSDAVQVGGILIDEIELVSSFGKKIDINNIVVEFSIYEASDQPFMTMDLLTTDALALTTRIPIVGSEKINISFRTPVKGMEEKPFQRVFRVLAIENLDIKNKARKADYIIKCYDEEYFYDITQSVQKSYSDQPVTDMVKDICKNYLLMSEKKIKDKVFASDTEGKPTLVIPNMRPSEAIYSLLCRYAKSKKYPDVSNYTFFSSQDGFHFTSYEDMIDITNKPSGYFIDKYTLREKNLNANANQAINEAERNRIFGVQNTANPEPPSESARLPKSKKPDEFLRINDFEFVNKINLRDALMSGMIDNTVYYINPTVRSFEKKTFNYVNDFEKMKALYMQTNKGKGFHVTETKTGDLKNLSGQSKNFLVLTNKENQSVNEDVTDKRYEYLGFTTASIAMLNSVVLNIYVPGDNTRKVGDLIEVVIPEYGGTDDIIGEIDAFVSGMYLVTAVRHVHNIESGYYLSMRIMKNCFEKSIEDVANETKRNFLSTKTTEKSQNTPTVS